MQVTQITARFYRKAKVTEWEPAEAECTIVASLAEGEDADAMSVKVMNLAHDTVVRKLREHRTPTPATAAETKTVTVKQVEVAPPKTPLVTPTPAPTGEAAKPAKAPRKAPAEGKPVTAAAPTAVAASEVPGDAPPQIRTNPENRVNPADEVPGDAPPATKPAAAAANDEVPGDATPAAAAKPAAAAEPVTHKTIIEFIGSAIAKHGPDMTQKMKAVVAKYGAVKSSDIKPENLEAAYADLRKAAGM